MPRTLKRRKAGGTVERRKSAKRQKSSAAMGRPRIHDPDPTSPEGQWAWWVRYHLAEDETGKELAEGVGAFRSLGFKWLNAECVPPLSRWPDIAKWLGLPPVWQSLVPPVEFVAYVKRYRKLPPDARFK